MAQAPLRPPPARRRKKTRRYNRVRRPVLGKPHAAASGRQESVTKINRSARKGAGNVVSLLCNNHWQSPVHRCGCDYAFRTTKVRRIWPLVGQANWISAVFRQMGLWQLSFLSSSRSVRVVLRNVHAFRGSSVALSLTNRFRAAGMWIYELALGTILHRSPLPRLEIRPQRIKILSQRLL